jgi:hypothetical protein
MPKGVERHFHQKKDKLLHGNPAYEYRSIRRDLFSAQKQARKLISGTSPTSKNRPLSFNRTQSRDVTGLLTGHNTLRRHLYIMGQINNP